MKFARFKNNKIYLRMLVVKQFLRVMKVRPIHIVIPVILSSIVAGLEGVSLGLMVPLAKGIVGNNYDFIKDIPMFRNIFHYFPSFAHFVTTGLSKNKSMFLFMVGGIFFVVIIKNIIAYVNSVIFAYWHTRFKNNIYKFIFNRFISFGKLFFDRTNQGYLNLVLAYSENMMELLKICERTINNFFILVVYFIIMLFISSELTIVTIALFPILHLSLRTIIGKIEKTAPKRTSAQVELSKKVFNILSCIPLFKAYSKEEETKKTYADINEKIRDLDFKCESITALVQPIQELIITGALLMMICVVALLLAQDKKPAEISKFVIFFYAARRSLPFFNIFNEMKLTLAQAKPPMKEITKILSDQDKFFIMDGEKEFKGLQDGILFNHLNFSYLKDTQVLKDVNFFIERGKVTAIVGPTGSGKTTLISLLVRFYDCPPNSILLNHTDIREFTLKSVRSHIALMSQDILLINDTIKNNVIFGLDKNIDIGQLVEITKKAKLYDFIMGLPNGFDTDIGDRGVKLSGGEKQRLAIARSLLKGSEIIILDEATSSLDSETEKYIQEAINYAMEGRTAIVIAHRLSTIKSADKIVVLESGRVLEEGNLGDLLGKKGRFYEYWQAQKFY